MNQIPLPKIAVGQKFVYQGKTYTKINGEQLTVILGAESMLLEDGKFTLVVVYKDKKDMMVTPLNKDTVQTPQNAKEPSTPVYPVGYVIANYDTPQSIYFTIIKDGNDKPCYLSVNYEDNYRTHIFHSRDEARDRKVHPSSVWKVTYNPKTMKVLSWIKKNP